MMVERAPIAHTFGKFVALQAAQPVSPALPLTAAPFRAPVPAMPATNHNFRKPYNAGTVGFRIWEAANALHASAPTAHIATSIVKVALPDVKVASISAALTQWRKYLRNA